MADAPLLSVEDLHVTYRTPTGPVQAVKGVSFELGREKLGIVGDVVNVSAGYGRNYLLPRGLATEPTEANTRKLAEARHIAEQERARERAELEALTGDEGARDLVAAHSAELVKIPVGDPGAIRDIDTPADVAPPPRV